MGKKRRILEGHKQVGKRFIPPMKQLPQARETSYVDLILPELIWIALINEAIGYANAARVLEDIVLAVEAVLKDDQNGNFALLSTYRVLDDDQKETLIESLAGKGRLSIIKRWTAPLTLLYDEYPLRFLGPPEQVISDTQLVDEIKRAIRASINKFETPGIVLNGAILLSRLATKKISFSSEIKLPDFNAVITDPNSDEAKHAAAFMRANALAEFGMLEIEPGWARYFWNRNYELSDCEIYEAESDE